MTAAEIAAALGGRRVGPGRWMAKCPAHEDRTPSLSIRQSDTKILVHCWGGCEQQAVIDALRARGLWPERPMPDRTPATPEEKRAWAARRRRAEQLAADAETWRAGMVDDLEAAKREAYEAGRLDLVILVAPLLEQMRGLHGAALAEAYLKAHTERPEQTAALIAARRRDDQIARKVCNWIVRTIGGAYYDANRSKPI